MTFQDGNPGGGRPLGSRNKDRSYARELFGEKGAKAKQVIGDLVEKGDKWAAAFILRQGPRRKGEPIEFEAPPIETAEDCNKAMDAVWQAMSRGVLTLPEAKEATEILKVRLQAIEATQMQKQLDQLQETVEREKQLKAQVTKEIKP